MRVLEQQEHRPLPCQIFQLMDKRREDPLALFSRIIGQWRMTIAGRHRQKVAEGGLQFRDAFARLGQ